VRIQGGQGDDKRTSAAPYPRNGGCVWLAHCGETEHRTDHSVAEAGVLGYTGVEGEPGKWTRYRISTTGCESSEVTYRKCIICGRVGLDSHLEILLRCAACGFVTANLEQSPDATKLYGDEYFCGHEYLDYCADKAFFQKNFSARLKDVLRHSSGGRLLEIGAAYGFFLDLAKQHFQVVGYEVNPRAARHARETFGVDVRSEDFLISTPTDIGGPVDVTVMWDVVEHLERPDQYLAHVAQLSRPGATLYITTGDIDSRLARWRGRKWRMIHPPTHLHYFSRATLTRLLAHHGFRVKNVKAVPYARSVRQILYSVLVLRMGKPRVYEAFARLTPARWGISVNTFDIMQVIAEKNR
jgi:2-polyprenyl-3-methyl-5-hydroxy-6-metoxy-1,4-benzoquinol methylase